jgi:hypothetical protein
MKRVNLRLFLLLTLFLSIHTVQAAAARLKPFVLGDTPAGDMETVVAAVTDKLTAAGFSLVGSYSPYPTATVVCATHDDLLQAAASNVNGGFGAALRIAVTEVDGKLQVSYVNPVYMGVAYGLGRLETVAAGLDTALGHVMEFGSDEGVEEKKLGPGKYHYKILMPYFNDIDELNTFADYQTAVTTVEENLAANKGGTTKVYRIDLPGQEVSVFGIGILQGDGADSGAKDTDREVMEIIDYQNVRSTAYLPYELMVSGNKVIALRGRYRIAVYFPDTPMTGSHGFTKIMSAPGGIKNALTAVAGK